MVPKVDEMRENRLRWLEHVLRKEDIDVVRVIKEYMLMRRLKRTAKKR